MRNLTLELSFKPFWDKSDEAVRKVAAKLFRQWGRLIDDAEQCSLMLWTADGSELLDYAGDLEERFEWAKYIGIANPPPAPAGIPPGQTPIYFDPKPYREDAPEFSYGDLKRIIEIFRSEFKRLRGARLRVGATFDPGPEFAKSDFKFRRHAEVCEGKTIGAKSFVCCYAELAPDARRYAGFPNGIPAGVSFGRFLGRQAKIFAADMGFDYLWLSNGFGFGLETWGITGAVFDGESFDAAKCQDVKVKILKFWSDFRSECPKLPIETRGTNFGTGKDLSCDGVPLREIYREVEGLQPPPNSPWAAINGDFGLELAGWLSHIAELPGESFPFRFYAHDPWFVNSPWLDRYGRSPHDIYLPLSLARLDAKGETRTPDSIEILTADNSFGELPDQVPDEATPHVKRALDTAPDEPGPIVWAYPFDEYHEMAFEGRRLEEIFFGDWFMRGAINEGFPLNSVVSSGNLAKAWKAGKSFESCVLVAPTAIEESQEALNALEGMLRAGAKALLYGPIASERLLKLTGLKKTEPLSGRFALEAEPWLGVPAGAKIVHNAKLSGGGLDLEADGASEAAFYLQDGRKRAAAARFAIASDGKASGFWLRGGNSYSEIKPGEHQPRSFEEGECFRIERLLRTALKEFGYSIDVLKETGSQGSVMTLRRSRNGLYLAGHAADMSAPLRIRVPEGAPVFTGTEVRIVEGSSEIHLTKASDLEARVFVEQDGGVVGCKELAPKFVWTRRRLEVKGLRNATVRVRPYPGSKKLSVIANPLMDDSVGVELKMERLGGFAGELYEAKGVTGTLVAAWQ